MDKKRIFITHLITGLNIGGAEMMLYKLLSRVDRSRFSICVISLTSDGPVGEKIQALGIPVKVLGMQPGMPNPFAILRLYRWLRCQDPDVIQTWMYHADLIGGVCAFFLKKPAIWNIRHSNYDKKQIKFGTQFVIWLCSKISKSVPSKIITPSVNAKKIHISIGYAPDRFIIIPNGFDTYIFKPNSFVSKNKRKLLRIKEDELVIGSVARFHPQKDHGVLIKAIGIVQKEFPNIKIVMCGKNVFWDNEYIRECIVELGIESLFQLIGVQDNLQNLYPAMDVFVSSSAFGEAFPNVIGEAMSCGVPCVVTDVGDSALIVGNAGKVVPPKNPQALAKAIVEILRLPLIERREFGRQARKRIIENYDIEKITRQYEDLYETVLLNTSD